MHRHSGLITDHSRQVLIALGQNIDLARARRKLTIGSICERAGITSQTYRRLVDGEAGVSLGVLMGVLTALDLEDTMSSVAAPGSDEVGIALERASRPKRVREGGRDDLDTDF